MTAKCVGCGLDWNVSIYQKIPRTGYICPHCESRLRAGETLPNIQAINDLESFLLGVVDRLLGSRPHIVCIIIDSYHISGLLHHIVIAFLIAFT